MPHCAKESACPATTVLLLLKPQGRVLLSWTWNPATLISTWKDALPSTLLSSMNFKGKPFYFVWKAWNDFTFWKCSLQHPLRLLLQYDNLLDTVVNTFSPQVLWWVAVCAALPAILAASSQHRRPSKTPIYLFITYKWVLLCAHWQKLEGSGWEELWF